METRLSKYKEYRNKLINEGNTPISTSKEIKVTRTLPLDNVMDVLQEDEKSKLFYKKQKNIRIIKFISIVTILILLIVAVILLGIFAFK